MSRGRTEAKCYIFNIYDIYNDVERYLYYYIATMDEEVINEVTLSVLEPFLDKAERGLDLAGVDVNAVSQVIKNLLSSYIDVRYIKRYADKIINIVLGHLCDLFHRHDIWYVDDYVIRHYDLKVLACPPNR